jgi:signal transduction histidine kinase
VTLAADTPSSSLPGLLTDLARVVRNHLPIPVPEAPRTEDALVRALCHDMRSPLAALEGLLDRLDDCGHPEMLQLAREQARHLSSLLRTANATAGAPERRGLRRLVDVVEASVAASGLPRDQLTVQLGEEACDVTVADARVQRILTNLLENAHRHGAGATVRLVVTRRPGWVDIALTQAGLAADRVADHLRAPRPPVDLTGLGLWSVQRQTRELGGRVLWEDDGSSLRLIIQLPDR